MKKHLTKIILLLILALSIGVGLFFSDGPALKVQSKLSIASNYLSAFLGDAQAQETLGTKYMTHYRFTEAGEKDPRDYKASYYWYKRAGKKLGKPGIETIRATAESFRSGTHGFPVDYAESIHWFELGDSLNDEASTFYLAKMYKDGQGVARDYDKARKLFLKTAEHDYQYGCLQLGLMDYHGLGLDAPDYAGAAKWLGKAAAQNNSIGCYFMGLMYLEGTGLPRDYDKAMDYALCARKRGHTMANILISSIEYEAYTHEKSIHSKIEWLKNRALQGDEFAQVTLGNLYAQGGSVAKNHQEAFRWYKMAADQGDEQSTGYLGFYYETGKAGVKNQALAEQFYLKAAREGDEYARVRLGSLYASDTLQTSISKDEIIRFVRAESETHHDDATEVMAFLYFNGKGVEKDVQKAVALFEEASARPYCKDSARYANWFLGLNKRAESGSVSAQAEMGQLFYEGNSLVLKDYREAFTWYEKAAWQNHTIAQSRVAYMYEKGLGTPVNKEKALFWKKKAAEKMAREFL